MFIQIFFLVVLVAAAQAKDGNPVILVVSSEDFSNETGLAYFLSTLLKKNKGTGAGATAGTTALEAAPHHIPEVCLDEYKDTSIHDIPYIVFLETEEGPCTGAILSNNWIVTTCTCANRVAPEKFKVRAGSDTREQGGSEHNVEKVINHEDYKILSTHVPKNNIALVKIKEPFIFDEKHFPVKLAKVDEVHDAGKMATVTGIRNDSVTLKSGELPVFSVEACKATFNQTGDGAETATKGALCLGYDYPSTKKCACELRPGDIITFDSKLIGIASWRPHCHDKKNWHPGVFTDIGYYRGWIYQKLKEE